MPARRLRSALSLLGKCVCKSILLAAVINISSCKNSAQQAWARPAEFLSFDHLGSPALQAPSPGALQTSPSPTPGSPARPQEHTPSPILPLHFCFIYEYVARIPMSYLFCGPVIFPPRPCRRLTQGPVATARRKEDSERILFNFFLCFTHFSLCLPPPSAAPSLPQRPLLSLTPFMLHGSLKLKPRRVL